MVLIAAFTRIKSSSLQKGAKFREWLETGLDVHVLYIRAQVGRGAESLKKGVSLIEGRMTRLRGRRRLECVENMFFFPLTNHPILERKKDLPYFQSVLSDKVIELE